jgi:TPR repeat protein
MILRAVYLAVALMLAQVAQFTYASMYEESLGHIIRQSTPQDHAEAIKWYSEVDGRSEATGQSRLGFMYHHGHTVPQDFSEAAKWYRLAAVQGHAMGLRGLGLLTLNGLGVPRDYIRGHMWLNLAAAAGDQYARKFRDDMAKLMTPAHVAKARRMTREWVAKHENAQCWFNNRSPCAYANQLPVL